MYMDCSQSIDESLGNGYDTIQMTAWVVDASTTNRISCSAKAVDYSGAILWSGATQTGNAGAGYSGHIVWSPDGLPGSPYIACTLPPSPDGVMFPIITGISSTH